MEFDAYLRPGKYADSDSPLVAEKARDLTEGCASDAEKAIRIHAYVRDLTFDIPGGFQMLLDGKGKASDFIREGRGFCMHKAAAFAALCRAENIPARIGFEIVDCPDKPFLPEKMRKMYGTRPQPWHSAGEVYLNGRWIVADCTVDRACEVLMTRHLVKGGHALDDNGEPQEETEEFSTKEKIDQEVEELNSAKV